MNCLNQKLECGLVLDTSFLTNIFATKFAFPILKSLGCSCWIDETVQRELIRFPDDEKNQAQMLQELEDNGLVLSSVMNDEEAETFRSFVDGDASTSIDDGAGATLSTAYHRELIAVIDERKASGLAKRQVPPIQTVTTVDILRLPCVVTTLTENHLSDAVFNALVNARMRVPIAGEDWVRQLIGEERDKIRLA